MRVRESKLSFHGWNPLWLFPTIILSGVKYDEEAISDYKNWFNVEIVWLAFNYELWVEFNKK